MDQSQSDYSSIEEIEFADGSIGLADLGELYEYVDLMAYHYGLGACKSLSEFTEMINNEDPSVLRGLINAANRRLEMQYGKKGVAPRSTPNNVGLKNSKLKDTIAPERNKLADFLIFMGAPKDKVDEAMVKIKSGKMKLPETDYSWITSEHLKDPNFDVKSILAQMKEDEKHSINFVVSQTTKDQRDNQVKDG